MKLSRFPLVLSVAALLPALPLRAAFKPGIVAADAKWAVQLDLASFRESAVGKELIATASKFQAQQKSAPVQVDVSKLLATIGNVTAYGANYSQDPKKIDGTLIVEGTGDLRKIAEGLIAQGTVSSPEAVVEIKDLPFEAYAVGKGDEQLLVALPKEPIVVLSKSKEQLLKALEVYRGAAPSLAKASGSPIRALLESDRHPYLRAACQVPSAEEFPQGAPQARILQMAQSAGVALGETDTHAFMHLQLLASSDEMADKLQKIVAGLAAMASLTDTNDKQLAEFLQSMAVKREGRRVSLDASYPSQRLVELIREFPTRQQQGGSHGHRSAEAKPEGKVVDQWVADQDLGGDTPAAEQLVEHTTDNVSLKQGMTIVLLAQPHEGEHARIDVVEVVPAGGGQPLRFEAEGMLLKNFRRESLPFASAGKVIDANTRQPATARFQFPAANGIYSIKVRYLDEKDGQSHFFLSLIDPAGSGEGQ